MPDGILIGGGHNNLITGIYLARAGWKVAIFERDHQIGGCLRTDEATLPGFRHDVLAGFHNLIFLSPAYRELRGELEQHGLKYIRARIPSASLFPDGETIYLYGDVEATRASIARYSRADAEACRELFATYSRVRDSLAGVLSSPPPSLPAALKALGIRSSLGPRGNMQFLRMLLLPPRDFAAYWFENPRVQAWFVPKARHTDAGPETVGGALAGWLYMCLGMDPEAGLATPAGGGNRLAQALAGLFRSLGGEIHTGREVKKIVVRRGAAAGVQLEDGTAVEARRAVIAGLAPTRLFLELVGADRLPAGFVPLVMKYRYGLSLMKIDLALAARPEWIGSPELERAAAIHLAPSVDHASLAYNEGLRGYLPREPLLVVGQHSALDPGRAPPGKCVLWVLARPAPYQVRGDAAGQIRGQAWDRIKESYADRIIDILSRYCPNLKGQILGRRVLSPLDMERLNPNLVHGDTGSGSLHLDQALLFRPFPGWSRYRTPIRRLYLTGAATHPGPGVMGNSGYALARMLTR
ncbi:MAG: NAD(P)/FAD-dependent oxidoreductase [Bacillota bacterium]|nr:NAD(P)/FAD-dependent oxidoreductase [Bacillota bacterium]